MRAVVVAVRTAESEGARYVRAARVRGGHTRAVRGKGQGELGHNVVCTE